MTTIESREMEQTESVNAAADSHLSSLDDRLSLTRRTARGLAGLNAAYHGAIGLLSVVSPSAAGAAYGLPAGDPARSALTRIVGGLMVGNALGLTAFTRDPEANPALAPL